MTAETGTIGYMAPEVLIGLPYDHKCDVYSFGICLWEIYSCSIPYSGLSPHASSAMYKSRRPEIPNTCPSALANIMKQCWEDDPKKRPEMQEVVLMLEVIDTQKKSKGGSHLTEMPHTKLVRVQPVTLVGRVYTKRLANSLENVVLISERLEELDTMKDAEFFQNNVYDELMKTIEELNAEELTQLEGGHGFKPWKQPLAEMQGDFMREWVNTPRYWKWRSFTKVTLPIAVRRNSSHGELVASVMQSGDLDCASSNVVISYLMHSRKKVNPTIINNDACVSLYMMDVDLDGFRPILRINIVNRSFEGSMNSSPLSRPEPGP
ncbi:hypothetical protein CQW23_27585 [Capsicum baccatum]|uniref:Protein kinase domain-containing protein n=1 Tax=Capsicum baccatum TaxID=33114 RepID=A0A2G2VE81_CAPBA|nr:hypothetical protein CQW23_27585 [Capsicum baccatum]